MRFTLRRALAVGAMLTVAGVVTPAVAAYSQDDPRSCNDLMSADTPAYVVCHWLAKPEEALGVAMFWLSDDGASLKEATPSEGNFIDCSAPGSSCPALEGDDTVGDENSPAPEGAEDGGTPECEAGQQCSVDGNEIGGDGTPSRPEPGSAAAPSTSPAKTAATQSFATTEQEIAAAAQTPAGQAVVAAKATGIRVWLDTELADDWKAGATQFAAAVKRVGALAARPEVAGIRFTSQLGYNTTFKTDEEITAFVTAASAALRQAAPGKRLGVHTVVPELACGADEACKTEMRKRYPLVVPERVETLLSAGRADQISLDTGLLYGGYETWKIDAEKAHRNQWIQVRARSWDVLAQVAAEETGLVGQVTPEQVATRASTPVMDGAAQQVNLWTRVQNAQGTVNRLTAWDDLKKLNPIKRRLAAVYNPTTPEVDVTTDLKKISEVFSQVYLTTA
ncbi:MULTISPECIES: hypothetical protein [Streptosporangium]|uniref:Uncharacterized protein n=1 Tax=Streptosporangium brasiliense TaxID=47480 RepID=A0ABT9R660_9ACTN|nr:hypothetical protein [Streptosporangium brasiliense]MDP9864734.1 hypothetical protein [Streptosporangium brasiliense]